MSRPRTRIVTAKAGTPFWHYDWTIEGQRFRGSTGEAKKSAAEKVALALRQRLVDEIRLGIGPQAQALTLDAALARYTEEYAGALKSFDTGISSHGNHLLRELGPTITLDRIDEAVVADLVAKLRGRTLAEGRPPGEKLRKDSPLHKRKLGAAIINRTLNTLGALLRRSREVWKLPAANPSLTRLRPPEPDGREIFLNPGQARAVGDGIIPHAQPIVALALLTGLRRGNVLQLDWSEVDLAQNRITVRVKSRKPGGKQHSVSLLPDARALLLQLAPTAAGRQGRVFRFGQMGCTCQWCIDHVGEPINGIKRAWRTARKAAGVTGLRFHDLRHTVASALLNEGHDLHMVQKVLGHADPKTSARYAHLAEEVRSRAMASSLAGFTRSFGADKAQRKPAKKAKTG